MSESPIPEPADPEDRTAAARALAWTSTVIAVAAAFLFVFNAAAMRSWAASLKPSQASLELASLTSAWEGETAKFGLSQPRIWVHRTWSDLRARTWRARAPDEAQRPPPG